MDGIIPDCKNGTGCFIPSLNPAAARALEIRDLLLKLSRMNIGNKILELYGAGIEDLKLIAVAEEEQEPFEENIDGPGSEMDTECAG